MSRVHTPDLSYVTAKRPFGPLISRHLSQLLLILALWIVVVSGGECLELTWNVNLIVVRWNKL